MRRTCKIFCGIVAAAMLLTGCGSGSTQSQSAAEQPAETSAVESEQAEPTPEPTEAPTPEPTKEPTLDDLDATEFRISDLNDMLGKTADEIEVAYPDATFISDNTDQTAAIKTVGKIVDGECRIVVQFMDGKAAATFAYFDLNNATSLYVGEKYMKIRNTLSQSMGDPVVAYDPVYTEVSASQIGMAVEDGKDVNEKWAGETCSAETYIVNAEDSAMLLSFYTQEYEDSLS